MTASLTVVSMLAIWLSWSWQSTVPGWPGPSPPGALLVTASVLAVFVFRRWGELVGAVPIGVLIGLLTLRLLPVTALSSSGFLQSPAVGVAFSANLALGLIAVLVAGWSLRPCRRWRGVAWAFALVGLAEATLWGTVFSPSLEDLMHPELTGPTRAQQFSLSIGPQTLVLQLYILMRLIARG
ncbi:hypothetical protein [Brevundimonas aurifodinae]|uniref:Uncharacterized protein n=1 Tax=Brevundimonas aurifodinae TaxID=1508312 RepID=A0ABV1NL25_9CAUL